MNKFLIAIMTLLSAWALIGCGANDADNTDGANCEPLTFETFCRPYLSTGASADDAGISKGLAAKIHTVNELQTIDKTLVAKGFECVSKKTELELNPDTEENEEVTVARYVRKEGDTETVVKQHGYNFQITFADTDAARAFMDTVRKAGYRNNPASGAYIIPGNDREGYWVGISVYDKGRIVEIRPHWG